MPWVTTMEGRNEVLNCLGPSATTTSFSGILFNIFFYYRKKIKKICILPKK